MRLPWKTECAWYFSLYWIYFLHSGFLSTFALGLKNRVCPDIFHCIEYTFCIQDFWANLRLTWKTACALYFSLYWIYFLHSWFLSNFRLTWKTECARKFFTVLIILFTFRSYEQLCACLEKQSVPWILSLYWIYFLHSGFLSHLRLPWKTACALKFFTVLNILFNIWIFEQLALALRNRVCPEIFHCIEYTFYIQDFWAHLHLAWKTECALQFFTVLNILFAFRIFEQLALAMKKECVLKIFTALNILFTFRIFEQLTLPQKTECDLKILTVLNIAFTFRIFEQLALALENRVSPEIFYSIECTFYIQDLWANLQLAWKTECALKFFTVLNIAFAFRIYEQIAIALKNRVCPEIFHCIEYTLYIQDFWATCACPEEQSMP